MALFEVRRYLGEDEEEQEQPGLKPSDILKKLQDEAKARRKSSSKDETAIKNIEKTISDDTKNDNDKATPDTKISKKNKRKHETADIGATFSDHSTDRTTPKKKQKQSKDLGNESVLSSPQKGKEKKLDKVETSEDKVVTDTEVASKRKKKRSKSHNYEPVDNKEGTITGSLVSESEREETDKDPDTSDQDQADNMEEEEEEGEGGDGHKSSQKIREVGGFTVIGDVRPAKAEKVKRVLPEWLSKPSVVSGDLKSSLMPVEEMVGLDKDLKKKLIDNNICSFFPVQMQVIPALLESSASGFHTGRAGYRPSDLCVSAPTGSGKTLAFVLPIVQALRSRVRCEVRALIVLPVRELASQVFKVFQTYCQGTCLKVGLLVGQKTFAAEQQTLVVKRLRGYHSQYDIIVATPGRLVDHINKTDGFSLTYLRYLVMDEADRMMEEVKQDWLLQVESAVHKSRPQQHPLTARHTSLMDMPLQKLLYSATLSQNPETLQQLNLFQPKLFTSVVKVTDKQEVAMETDSIDKANVDGKEEHNADGTTKTPTSPKKGDFVGKYSTPAGLTEYSITTEANNKPLIVLHLIHNLQYRNILCFTNSVEATHRLYLLLKLVGGVEVREFSSGLHAAQRDQILQKFAAGKIDIIICTDAMARGMDISNVKYVVSYDTPGYIQTYIHRIGRTARAGKDGTAFTLLQEKEFFHFKKMVREAGKQKVPDMKVLKKDLKLLQDRYEAALKQLPEVLKTEKEKKKNRRLTRGHTNKSEETMTQPQEQ